MADWFKFYENDLDETRLQYAVSKLPEVIPVWVGILSEACRHKVGTVSWGSDEIELFGFSKRLGVSIPKVNEAINLLEKIRYISRNNDSITVIKWNEKQSEYCQKKTARQNQSGDNNPMRVGTLSGHCRDTVGQEERRGEEIEEINNTHTGADFPEANIPSLQEVLKQAESSVVTPESATKFFNHHQDNQLWLNQYGRMIDWKRKLISWQAEDRSKLKSKQPEPKQLRETIEVKSI